MSKSYKKISGIWFIIVPIVVIGILLYNYGVIDSVLGSNRHLTPKTVMQIIDSDKDFDKISRILKRKGFSVDKQNYNAGGGKIRTRYDFNQKFHINGYKSNPPTHVYDMHFLSDQDMIFKFEVSDDAFEDFEHAIREYVFVGIDGDNRDFRYPEYEHFLIDDKYVFILEYSNNIIAMNKDKLIPVSNKPVNVND